jgi:hypothetical protein
MKTFAFSTSSGYFTSRYSFEPDCYASVDNVFISMNKVDQTPELVQQQGTLNNICWVHNVNPSMNTFYDNSYRSEISVVSNENASKEKVFNSLSLELNRSNPDAFFSTVSTNLEDPSEVQLSSIPKFVRREGNLYSSIGSSSRNSTSNIKFIGYRVGSFFQVYVNPQDATTMVGFYVDMYFPTGHVPTGNSARLYVQNESNMISYLPNPSSPQIASFTKNTQYNASKFYIDSIIGSGPAYRVFIKFANQSGDPTSANLSMLEEIDDFFEINKPVFAVSNAVTHGDSMRGKYALVFLSTTETAKTQPFELYAINVDYAQSKLDSSLG